LRAAQKGKKQGKIQLERKEMIPKWEKQGEGRKGSSALADNSLGE